MHLLIDIGNSTVVVALTDNSGNIIEKTWRFKTLKDQTMAYYRHELYTGSKKYQINFADITKVVISSVVPEVNDDIAQAISDLTGVTPLFFTIEHARRFMTFDVESPSQVGKDRLADAIGAICCYGTPAIIIDMGTATTVSVIDEDRRFLGGMIIPGTKTSLAALSNRASQLPSITIEHPHNVIGKNTLENMHSGIVYGTAAMIDGIIEKIIAERQRVGDQWSGMMQGSESGKNIKIIGTGGMAKTIMPYCQHDITVDDHLIFKGLNIACSTTLGVEMTA